MHTHILTHIILMCMASKKVTDKELVEIEKLLGVHVHSTGFGTTSVGFVAKGNFRQQICTVVTHGHAQRVRQREWRE